MKIIIIVIIIIIIIFKAYKKLLVNFRLFRLREWRRPCGWHARKNKTISIQESVPVILNRRDMRRS